MKKKRALKVEVSAASRIFLTGAGARKKVAGGEASEKKHEHSKRV